MGSRTRWAMSTAGVVLMVGTGALAAPPPAPAAPAKASEQPAAETVTLKRGEVRRLEVRGLNRVSVADPHIADINVAGAQVLEVTGVAEGTTTVLLWTEDNQKHTYTVHVGK